MNNDWRAIAQQKIDSENRKIRAMKNNIYKDSAIDTILVVACPTIYFIVLTTNSLWLTSLTGLIIAAIVTWRIRK